MEAVAAFVLAGGRSSRMGSDKALLELGGRPLISRALELVSFVTSDVKIVGPPAKCQRFGTVIEDVYHDRGPLGGIHTALANSQSDLNLVLGVDLPFVEPHFISHLTTIARASLAVVSVPYVDGHFQSLCATYRKAFANIAEAALNEGKNKVDALFTSIPVRVISEDEIVSAGFSPGMFRNLNTRADWQQAQREFTQAPKI